MPGGRDVGDSIVNRVLGQRDSARCIEAAVQQGIREAMYQASYAEHASSAAPEAIGSDQSAYELGPESKRAGARALQLFVRPTLQRFPSSFRLVGPRLHRRTR
jgi:hypothetical protein